jgi:cell division protein FtsQ
MPRLSATRTAPASVRARAKKPATQQDRLKARTLFFRRVKRSLKPGLWVLGGVFVLVLGSAVLRAAPSIGPVISPASGIRHGLGAVAAAAGFRVRDIVINGADTTPASVIEAALGVGRGDPILGFSLGDAVARLEQLGPVQTATIQRALPDTLIVGITERAPYAIWQSAGAGGAARFLLIDKAGHVIADQDAAAAKRRNPGLLLLVGADAPVNAGALMAALAQDPAVLSRVAAAQRVDGLRWNLTLRNQTLVKLPMDDEQAALDQLDRLQASMGLLDRPVQSIDLRVPARMIIHPYPAAAPAAAAAGLR